MFFYGDNYHPETKNSSALLLQGVLSRDISFVGMAEKSRYDDGNGPRNNSEILFYPIILSSQFQAAHSRLP